LAGHSLPANGSRRLHPANLWFGESTPDLGGEQQLKSLIDFTCQIVIEQTGSARKVQTSTPRLCKGKVTSGPPNREAAPNEAGVEGMADSDGPSL